MKTAPTAIFRGMTLNEKWPFEIEIHIIPANRFRYSDRNYLIDFFLKYRKPPNRR